MIALEKEIQNLSKSEKISIMEKIWADLTKDEDSIEIHGWHIQALEETEKRIKEGKEHFLDWESAKEVIRNA